MSNPLRDFKWTLIGGAIALVVTVASLGAIFIGRILGAFR